MIAGFVTSGWCRGAETSGKNDDGPIPVQGGSAAVRPRPYTGADAGILPIPLLAYEGTFWGTSFGLLGLSVVTDALGRHRGHELEFSYTRPFSLVDFDFFPSMGMRWRSQDLVDYCYGVRPDERPGYAGSSSLDAFVRLSVRRMITSRWSLQASVQYEWLDGSIADSPIMDANHEASLLIGMCYSW